MKNAQTKDRNFFSVLFIVFVFLLMSIINVGLCSPLQSQTKPAKKIESKVKAGGEKIKSKFNETADSLSKEKIHESIDQAMDYLDKEALKERIDEIADYLDRDKIKDFIDYIADHLDKEKVKEMIDFLAESLDREKIKDVADNVIESFDKEKIKEEFNQTVNQITSSLQAATHALEKELLQVGSNKNAVQDLIKKYNWKQYIQDSVSYGPATLSNLKLGGLKRPFIVANPGQEVDGEVVCFLNPKECSSLSLYRVVLGLKHRGGQTTIFNHFGLRAGKETDHFTLKAPKEKGVYEIAFQVVKAAREATALKSWEEPTESGYGQPATIGLLIVH